MKIIPEFRQRVMPLLGTQSIFSPLASHRSAQIQQPLPRGGPRVGHRTETPIARSLWSPVRLRRSAARARPDREAQSWTAPSCVLAPTPAGKRRAEAEIRLSVRSGCAWRRIGNKSMRTSTSRQPANQKTRLNRNSWTTADDTPCMRRGRPRTVRYFSRRGTPRCRRTLAS